MKLFIIIFFFLKLTINCEQICPKCNQVFEEGKFHVTDDIIKRRWQTPKRGDENYQPSYQDLHSLVGYADIKYTDLSREEADVCIVATHRNQDQVKLKYFFNDEEQLENCRRFNNQFQKGSVRLRVEASDQTKLILDPVDFLWNLDPFLERSGDYRSGQKGAIVEMFGWPMIETEQECSLLGRAGYLGVKLSPVNEHIMSDGVENGALNPWYYPYQPISYRFNSRAGTQENLVSLIRTCRSHGIRVYVDVILNHFTGHVERRSGKKSSAPIDRQSPFFTADDEVNPSTNQPFSYEYPGADVGPEDFHCERALDKWDDLNVLNTGWLAGLADLNTTRESIRERQAAFLVEMMSLGVSGFRIDAGKHMSPEDEADIFRRVQLRMGGRLPPDFIVWLEVLTGEQADVLWYGPSWYGTRLANRLLDALGAESELDKIKLFDSGYPVKPWENRAVSSHRIVIQNDDHDSQSPVFYRDFGDRGCILVKGCPPEQHRYFEQRLFADPYEVTDNDNDWPIRILLTSFYHTYGHLGVPDGLSDCNLCKINRDQCVESVPYSKASVDGACAYEGNSYTRVHRDIGIINSLRKWMKLDEINGSDIGLPNCR